MDRLTPEQVEQLHALPMDQAIRYWDALEAEGRRLGKLNQVVRLLCQVDLY